MLLERETELERLNALLADPDRTGGVVVLIRGEAGIGKSALVRAFAGRAENIANWYWGYCDDLGTPRPFAPFWDLAADAPDVADALTRQDRHQVFDSLYRLLDDDLRPGVLVLEDTHWSDEATVDAIRYLGRRVARTRGLLILTYRTGEVGQDHPLRSAVGDLPNDSVVRIEPASLSRQAVAEIVADVGLDPDEVTEVTGGNPFLVTEMAVAGGDVVPTSVRDSVIARVDRLSGESRAMLKSLAVIPGHVSTDEVAAITARSLDEVAECERMELLQMTDGQVAFRHDLIRRAVESTLTTSELVDAHRRVLGHLPADSDPARLVHHALGAIDIDRFVPLALEAARRAAAVSSNREAAAHYRSVEPYVGTLAPEVAGDVFLEWAAIEHYLDAKEAAPLVDRSLGAFRETQDARRLPGALVTAVDIKRSSGRFDQAHAHADEAIALLEGDDPSPELAAALAAKSWLLIHRGDIVAAESMAGRARRVARSTGNEAADLSAEGVLGTLAYVRGRPGGLDLMEQVRRRARDGGNHFEEVNTLLRIGRVAVEIRDLARAADYGTQAMAVAARYELSSLETEALLITTESRLGMGEWSSAEDSAVEAIGRHPSADVRFERIVGLVGLRAGRRGALDHLDRAWRLAEASDEIDHLLEVGAALVEAMWILGTADDGMIRRCEQLVQAGIDYEYPWPAGWLAYWLWNVGAMSAIPDGVPAPWVDLSSGRIAAAADFWQSRRYPYERALCVARGDRNQRLEAVESMEVLGATAVASKLRRELRQAGVAVPRGRGRATRSHEAGLTGRQAEVLTLLAEGLTNPEIADRLFVSTRTVENHVSAVFSKLGATGRVEVVEEARRRGLITA